MQCGVEGQGRVVEVESGREIWRFEREEFESIEVGFCKCSL